MIKFVAALLTLLLITTHLSGALIVNHTDGGIQVDGYRESAWDTGTPLDLSNMIFGEVDGSDDYSAQGWMIWNEVGLYLFIEIHDDVFIDNESIYTTPWEDDTVELYFDFNNSKNNGFYDEDDIQFFINFENSHTSRNNYVLNIGNGLKHITTTRNHATGVKTVEVMLPWHYLKMQTIQSGMQFGFDMMLNDDDDGGATDTKISWHMAANDETYRDPSKMGTIQLGGSKSYTLTSSTHQRVDHFLYVVIEYKDAAASLTLNDARNWIQKLEKFYQDASDNRYRAEIRLVPTVVSLPGTTQEYEQSIRDLASDVQSHVAENNGYTHLSGASYDYQILHYPQTGREFSGRYNKGVVWVNDLRNHPWGLTVLAHEMGHAIGLSHCGMTAGQRISPLAEGDWLEYGSPDDTMGNPTMGNPPRLAEFNLSSKAHMGWVLPSQIHIDPAPGTYRIYAHDQSNSLDVNGIRLANPRYSENPPIYYWISLRANAVSQNQATVQVHFNPPEFRYYHGFYSTELLDMTPHNGVVNGYELPLNEWYWDSWNNHAFRIVQKGETAGKAWADIEYRSDFDGANAEVLHAHLGKTYSYRQNWTYTENLGFLKLVKDGYVFHPEIGWLFIAQGDFQSGLILYSLSENRWYFTSTITQLTPVS